MPNGSLGLTEMYFQIRAENFGPLAAKVFRFVGDDGCRTGMSPFLAACVRFTPESRRGSGRSRESEVDPKATFIGDWMATAETGQSVVRGVLGQGPLADQIAVVRPMLFICRF